MGIYEHKTFFMVGDNTITIVGIIQGTGIRERVRRGISQPLSCFILLQDMDCTVLLGIDRSAFQGCVVLSFMPRPVISSDPPSRSILAVNRSAKCHFTFIVASPPDGVDGGLGPGLL